MEAPMTVKKMTRAKAEEIARALSRSGRTGGQGAALSGAALRRPAAARGDRARAGDGAGRCVLFDEPTSALDPKLVREVAHAAALARRSPEDAGRRLARHGLRAGDLRSGDLLRGRPGRRVGHGERGVRQPDSSRRRARSWRLPERATAPARDESDCDAAAAAAGVLSVAVAAVVLAQPAPAAHVGARARARAAGGCASAPTPPIRRSASAEGGEFSGFDIDIGRAIARAARRRGRARQRQLRRHLPGAAERQLRRRASRR